jgi:molybdopterin molybdotransferase
MTDVAEAERLILDNMPRFPPRAEPLGRCVDRVLAEAVFAERDQPPFDRVTMDGIAIARQGWADGTREFEIVGMQAAGVPALALSSVRQCIEVMTGAMLPAQADTVIPVERIERHGTVARVSDDATVTQHQFVHARGTDRAAGSLLLEAGMRLGPPEVAVLASAGRGTVMLAALPRVAVISTGDELVDVDQPVEPHQIRSSNDWALEASLARHALALVTRAQLKDSVAALVEAIARLHAQNDVLILSGGVSMGQFDFVPSVLKSLGAELVFHRIEQRPGRPMWFGLSRERKPIFALPGNPVSTLVCATRYVLPALRRALGLAPSPADEVVLSAPVDLTADLTYFMPVKWIASEQGRRLVEPRPTNTSGDFASLAGTDGFVELPRERRHYAAGSVVHLYRW